MSLFKGLITAASSMSFSGFLYGGLWLAMAIYLVYAGKKYGKICYVLSILFFFMAGWFVIDQFLPVDLLSGGYAWIFRGVMLVFLVLALLYYFNIRKKK